MENDDQQINKTSFRLYIIQGLNAKIPLLTVSEINLATTEHKIYRNANKSTLKAIWASVGLPNLEPVTICWFFFFFQK